MTGSAAMGRAKRGLHGSRGSRVTALVALLGLTVQAFTLAGLGWWVVEQHGAIWRRGRLN